MDTKHRNAIAHLVALAGWFVLVPPPAVVAQGEAASVERRIEVGEFYLRSGRWQEAADVFQPLSERPDAPASVFRGLGEAYLNSGRRDDAVRALEEANRRGADPRARLLLVDLLSDRREGWPRAIDLLQVHVAENPADTDSQRRLADLLIYVNRIDEAVPVLRGVVAARPDDAPTLLLYARALSWTGSFAEAAPLFDRALAAGGALQPDDNKLVAQAQEAVGNDRRANQLYRAHVQTKPNDPVALAGLARTSLALDRQAEARDAIDALRAAAQQDPALDLTVARLDVEAGRREAALPVFARAMEVDPNPALAQEYADLLVSVGRANEAVEVISRYPDPSAAGAANRLRILAAAPGRQDEARSLALDLMRGSPSAEVSTAARQVVLSSSNRDVSLELVDAVARRYPRDRALQSKLATMLRDRGQNRRAERVLADLRTGAPRDANVLASLVATQVDNGNRAAAKQTLADAGPVVDRDARLLSLRAGLRFADGDVDAAGADYAAALELDPRLPEARIGLAEVALAKGDAQEAERLIAGPPRLPARSVAALRQRIDLQNKLAQFRALPNERLADDLEPLLRAELQRDPSRVDYRLTLAQVLESSGRSREALAQYGALQVVEPPLREAYLAPVRIHLAIAEPERAEAAFARFREHFPGEESVAQARLFAAKGERRKRAGDFAGALDAYRQALEMAPRDVSVWNGVAGVHFAAGNAAAALDGFENALAIDPTDGDARAGRVEALLAIAGTALNSGERAVASQNLERALAVTDDPRALGRVADLALAAQDWELARRAAERLPSGSARDDRIAQIELERDLATRLGDPQAMPAGELLALARRGLQVQPERADLQLLEAQALERLGETEAALAAFRSAAQKGSVSPDAYGGQVRTGARLGRLADAEAALEQLQRRDAAAARDAEIELRLAQANLYRDAGRPRAAFDAAAAAARLEPDNYGARMTYAAAAADAGDLAVAIQGYEAALALRPGDVDANLGLAGAHFAAGRLEEALAAFDAVIDRDPVNRAAIVGRADVLAGLAGRAAERGELAQARDYAERSLARSGGVTEALETTARTAVDVGAFDVADRALAGLPASAGVSALRERIEVRSRLASLTAAGSDAPLDETLAAVEDGLDLEPERADLLLLRAQLLERKGEAEQALTAFRRAAAVADPPADAYAGQVRTLAALGRVREAREAFGRLRGTDASAVELSLLLAEANVLKAEGRAREALDVVARAREIAPGDPGVLATAAGLHTEVGELDRAIDAYRAALAARPQDPDLFIGLAGAYFAGGQLRDALPAFDEALRLSPGNRRAVIGRTDVLAGLAADAAQRGDAAAARSHAEDSLRGSSGVPAALERTLETALRIGAYDVATAAVAALPPGARRDQLARLVEIERGLVAVRANPQTVGAAELALIDEALRLQPERVDLALIRAQALERSGSAEAALRAYRRLAELPSPPAEAYAGQVRVLSAMGRTREAARVLATLRTRVPEAAGDAELVLLLTEAEAAKRSGRTSEALAAAERALSIAPGNVDARMTLAGIYAEAGRHDDAIAAYEAVLAARPGDPVARRGLAGALFARGDLAKAAALYDELLIADPSDAELRSTRVALSVSEAGALLQANRVDAAERLLDRALQLDPANRDALALKLQIVAGREQWAEARSLIAAVGDRTWRRELEGWLAVEEGVASWRRDSASMATADVLRLVDRGLRANPERVDLRLMRAQVLERSGDGDGALTAYRELARRDDAPVEAVAGQVRLLTELGRFAEAEALLDRLVVLRPEAANSERAKLTLARATALRGLGRSPAAFAAARDALALQPGDPEALTLLGWIYLDTGQPADAAASFASVLEARPRDLTALQGLATAQEALGDWQAAERTYLELAALPSGSYPVEARQRIELRRALAQVQALRTEGRLGAAADLLENVRQRQPRDPDVWASLSEVRNEMGQASLALTYAEQGLRLAPDAERLHLARIRALARLGRYDDARVALRDAAGHAGRAELARLGNEVERGRARAERERYLAEGRLDLAYLALAEEFQMAPNDADVLRAIGYLYLQTEQYPEARQFFSRAVRLEPQDPAGQLGLAYALRGAGEPGLAIERIESVMRSRPSADAALALAELYHEQGRNHESSQMLAQARRLGGEPRRVLPPLRIDQARAVAPELRAERGSVLPPLMLPEGVMRAVPDRPPAVPVYEDLQMPAQRSIWRDGRLGAAVVAEPLAFADTGIVNDAAPPEAWAFAGPALDALRRDIAAEGDGEPIQLAQALPSFDRVMGDVRGAAAPATVPPAYDRVQVRPLPGASDAPIREEILPPREELYPAPRDRYPSADPYSAGDPYAAPDAYRAPVADPYPPVDPYVAPRPAPAPRPGGAYGTVEDYIPTAPQPYAVDPTLPPRPRAGAPSPYEERYRYYRYGDVAPGTAPVPDTATVPPVLPAPYARRLYLEREPAGAGLPIREPIAPPEPLDARSRARLTALERKLAREQTMKVSVGFRYDFLDSVSDVIADEFAIWRFPLFLEVPALINSRLRLTAEPTVVDNGIVTDAGVAGEVALLGMRLGTEIVQLSGGVGVTPAGFADDPDITGFGRLTLQIAQNLSLTPFFERKPVIESLLSYRGNEREGIFFGKVMQNRFGGTVGYRTPQEISGVFEVAYSTLEGVQVEDNEKIDAFFSIGRDFDLASGYVVRPGAQAYFFSYDKDLSESYPLGLDPVVFPPDEFPPGAGYFSPDSFLEAVLRLDLSGPLMPYTFPGSTFRVGGRVGGQWVSGLDTPRFASAEGSRATFGGDGGIDVPFGEVVVFSAGAGFVIADPYDRVYFEMALLFPL